MQRILLIGAGAIGKLVLRELAKERDLSVTHVLVSPRNMGAYRRELPDSIEVIASLDKLDSLPDFALECAGYEAVHAHVPTLLRRGVDVALASVGSLAEAGLIERLEAAAKTGRSQLTLIAGAVAGIDGIAAAKVGGLSEVIYTSRKPPLGWTGSPVARILDLKMLREPTTIFEGTARDAARLYPKNANVAATVALAGLGLDRTKVSFIADPSVTKNIHQVRARGAFGELELTLSGRPLPDNPKTSALAAYSAVRMLRNRVAPFAI